MYFDSWADILNLFIKALFIYIALIIILRVSGKRTLSKWNAFDFIITIAHGSVLASVVLSKDITIVEGIFAFVFLIGFQFIITFVASRVEFFDQVIKADPTLLYFKGEFREDAMKKQRVSKSEIVSAIRSSSIGSLKKVEAVVLETDGEFSVIEKSQDDDGGADSTLRDVEGYEQSNESH